jgi:hypothetical protein
MADVNLMELTKQIVRLQKLIYREFVNSGQINRRNGTLLADCLDYYRYLVVDLIEGRDQEKSQELIDHFMKSESYCKKEGDWLHADFFATLLQLISSNYTIAMLRGQATTREVFEKSWQRTREELRL